MFVPPTILIIGNYRCPTMRDGIRNVFRHESVLFINLSDVVINETEQANFVPLTKPMIESLIN